MGRHSVCAPCLPSDIPPVESTGASYLPSQSRPAATMASAALYGQNLRLPPATTPALSAASAWGANPPLEPNQLLLEAPEEAFLVDTPGMPPSDQEASQRQSAVFKTRTKNPLVDEGALPIVVHLPQHTLTSYEHAFAHLPLLCTCHSTLQPHNIIL